METNKKQSSSKSRKSNRVSSSSSRRSGAKEGRSDRKKKEGSDKEENHGRRRKSDTDKTEESAPKSSRQHRRHKKHRKQSSFDKQFSRTVKSLHADGALTLDQLEPLSTVGTGTFGRVFVVRHKPTNNPYALKVMNKHDIVRLKQVTHIKNEREILFSLQCPFVVDTYAAFQDNHRLYLLMEFVVGGEIFSHLRRSGRFSPEVARFYAAEIVLALEHMHSRDIVYRDLKPENLLLDKDGHVKITDFGFAKVVRDRTWTLCGTPEYLAPEIIQSKGHGKAVDWWALGIFLYEMLAGYPPFFDDNPFGIYEKILLGQFRFPSHVDANARDLIRKLLKTNHSRRIGNLRGGAQDIKQHKWFAGVDWDAVLNRQVQPPIVPLYKDGGDTCNFEEYDEDWDWIPRSPPPDFGDMFKYFVDPYEGKSSSSSVASTSNS